MAFNPRYDPLLEAVQAATNTGGAYFELHFKVVVAASKKDPREDCQDAEGNCGLNYLHHISVATHDQEQACA